MIRIALVAALFASVAVLPPVAADARPAADPDPGTFVSVTPTRILDTRDGTGTNGVAAKIPAQGSLSFAVTGVGGVPTEGVAAVAFNLTRTNAPANGYVAAYPAGASGTDTSVLNGLANQARAHEVVVEPGAGGRVTLVNGSDATVDLVADVSGYYTAGAPTAGGGFTPVTPARVFDTRTTKTPLGRTTAREVQVTGKGGVPTTGAGMALVNVTVTAAASPGYLAVNAEAPVVGTASGSNVNFPASTSISNLAAVPLDTAGRLALSAHFAASARVDVIVDVFGWYVAGSPAAAGRTGGLPELRLYDSRSAGGTSSPIPAHGSRTVAVAGHGGVPSGVSAVALNLTAVTPSSAGYLTAYPAGTAQPVASTVNFTAATIANATLVPLGTNGSVTIYNGASTAQQVLADIQAYVGPPAGPYAWSARTAATEVDYFSADVSCAPNTTFCIRTYGGTAQTYDGTSWSAPRVVNERFTSIDCVTVSFCMATGYDRDEGDSPGDHAYEWNGTDWVTQDLAGVGFASSVSCTSVSFCMALGDLATSEDAYGWRWDGTTWTRTSGAPLNYNYAAGPTTSCASPTFCLAVDGLGNSARWTGSGWSSVPAADVGGAVSCVSSTFCVTVGSDRDDRNAKAQVFTGSGWSAATILGSVEVTPIAVDCATVSRCVAALRSSDVYRLPFAGSLSFYDGSGWSAPSAVDGDAPMTGLSCASATWCLGVDHDGSLVGTA